MSITSKQTSKVSNKSNTKSKGDSWIGHNDLCDSFTNLSQLRMKIVNRLITNIFKKFTILEHI